MLNKYEQIREEQGEVAAKEYMRLLRSKVRKPSGMAALTPAQRKQAALKRVATRKRNAEAKQAAGTKD